VTESAEVRADQPILSAGLITGMVRENQLVDIRVGGWPAIDAIYASVRDAQWGTVPSETIGIAAVENENGSSIVVRAQHVASSIKFESTITASAVGDTLTVVFDGLALSDFEANRIGLSVLHPLELVGSELIASTTAGDARIRFTDRINPQVLATDLVGLAYDVALGLNLRIGFDGDLFEMEDHRNWTDPGWKTYCTPLRRPRPATVARGQRIHQQIVLHASGSTEPENHGPLQVLGVRQPDRVDVRSVPVGIMPALGILFPGLAKNVDRFREVVTCVAPTTLHVELEEGTSWRAELTAVADLAAELDVALTVTAIGASERWLSELGGVVAVSKADLLRLCLVNPDTLVTAPDTVPAMRGLLRSLGCHTLVGGGSLLHFAELNRLTCPTDEWEFASFPVTPQAHHADDASIVGTVRAQPYALADAAAIAGPSVVVSPITMRARSAPTMRASSSDPPDSREATAFGAAWMLASTAAMSAAIELNWLLDIDSGADAPARQRPDLALLRSLARRARQPTLGLRCSSERLAALAFPLRPGVGHVMIANLAPVDTDVEVNRRRVRLKGHDWTSLDVPLGTSMESGADSVAT
jgi:hypothetical protein